MPLENYCQVGHPGYRRRLYKFESTVNAVAAETPEDSGSLALNSEFDIQTDGSRRSAGSEAGQPDLQELLESAQNLSHRDYVVYRNKVIEMFDADGYSK